MKKNTIRFPMAIALGLALTLPAYASGTGEHGHSETEHGQASKGHHEMGDHEMDHDDHLGYEIHESVVEGYTFAYHLIDMDDKMKEMEGMKGMSMKGVDMSKMPSHHMMLYVMGPDGKMVTEAKVGYKVEGPEGKEQKAMAMAMKGGYGADVDLKAKGTYEIKTKAVVGDKKLMDEFKYEVR